MTSTSCEAPASADAGQRDRRVAWVVAGVAAIGLGAWVTASLLMRQRGLDLSDESFYLLSYRWWDTTPRTVSGVQYIYGPIFEALGYSIPSLRLFRLTTVVLAHLVLGISVMRLVSHLAPGRCPAPVRWGGVLLVVCAGGFTYGWLPLSPGYNDVALLATTCAVAILCAVVLSAARRGVVPVVGPTLVGATAAIMALAKWSATIPTFVVLIGATALLFRVIRPAGMVKATAAFVAGAAGLLLVVHVGVMSLTELLPPLLETTGTIASSTNSPSALLALYARTTAELFLVGLLLAVPIALIATAAVRVSAPATRRGLHVAAWAALALVILQVPGGGVRHLDAYPVVVTALFLAALLVLALARVGTTRSPSDDPPLITPIRRWLFAVLFMAPALQALGTGNPLSYLAVNAAAMWVALLVSLAALSSAGHGERRATFLIAAALGLYGAWIGTSGLLLAPYRTDAFRDANSAITSPSPVGGLLVAEETAKDLNAIVDSLGQATVDGDATPRPIMAFDELPGLVLLLDGRSVGEAWYSASDRRRTAAGIATACRGVSRGDALLLVARPLTDEVVQSLTRCGWDPDNGVTVPVVNGPDWLVAIDVRRSSPNDR